MGSRTSEKQQLPLPPGCSNWPLPSECPWAGPHGSFRGAAQLHRGPQPAAPAGLSLHTQLPGPGLIGAGALAFFLRTCTVLLAIFRALHTLGRRSWDTAPGSPPQAPLGTVSFCWFVGRRGHWAPDPGAESEDVRWACGGVGDGGASLQPAPTLRKFFAGCWFHPRQKALVGSEGDTAWAAWGGQGARSSACGLGTVTAPPLLSPLIHGWRPQCPPCFPGCIAPDPCEQESSVGGRMWHKP